MKKIVLLFGLMVGVLMGGFAQTDQRTRETKIADIVMLLPAGDTESFNHLMGELFQLGDVIGDLTPRLTDSGGGDTQLRYAISGLAMFASNETSRKKVVATSICNAITKAKSDEVRDFLLIQLQYVAGEESVESAASFLTNARLADAAARVLVRIGSDKAGTALRTALKTSNGVQQIAIIEALGEMRYHPAYKDISAFVALSGEPKARKAMWRSLALIAEPSSEKMLSQVAKSVGYKYEPTDAFGSYILFLYNSLPAQSAMVAKSAQNMLKATSESTQIAAKSAALELLTLSAGEKAIGNVTDALKSSNKQYRQAALNYSTNIKSVKMYDELMKFVKKEKRDEVKAEIVSALGSRGDKAAWPFVQECLADGNNDVRASAITAAGKLAGAEAVALIVKAMNTNDEQVVTAGKNTLLSTAGEHVASQVAAAIPQTSAMAKVAFLEILAARKAHTFVETIFAQTSSIDGEVRLAAVRALASVVAEKDVTRIARLLNTASDKNEIGALQRAMYAAMSGLSQSMQTDIVVEQVMRGNNPDVYGNVLAMVGGEAALELVMSYGFNSGDAHLKEVAFEALLNWSDALAISQLYKIAVGAPSGAYFDRALSAYVTKTGASRNTPEQKLLMLRDALEIAQTATQKQAILRQIGRTGTFVGLLTAGRYLDERDNDVQQAAVQAVRAIALAHPEYYGTEVTKLLNKAIAVNRDPEAGYQKEAILKHLAGLPQDEGFVLMFNGKDLTGWKGLVENPIARAKMTPRELAQKQVKADEIMRRDWTVHNGVLVFDGPGYDNLCSEKDYGDFELYVDWRIGDNGDTGIYLRGSPQVQIWDISMTNVGAQVGSGGLYNNRRHPNAPLLVADNPVNKWNSFYIKMLGEKVTIYLNGQLVADNVTLENYWDRNLPIFEQGAIELQAHRDRVEFRDIYIREIPRPEPYRVSDTEKAEGFVPIFNGIDMSGWVGNLRDYVPLDGAIVCDPTHGGNGNLYTDKEYSDFILRFEFMLTPAANNGIGIRTPLEGDAAYVGMEIQVLDNEAPVYRNLHEWQYHGSVYGVIPAKRGYLKPLGEWNVQEIIADGNHIKVTLNGTVILDGDIAQASKNFTQTIDGYPHPGLSNKSGHIGFLGHGSWVAFRNLRVKELKNVIRLEN